MEDEIKFIASIPLIQSGIKIGEGMRLQLDISEKELPNAIRILELRNKNFEVKITKI
jgi:hypothetical protein